MTDLRISEDYRLLQVFLSGNGVFEVYIHIAHRGFACTCAGWRARQCCKHVGYVAERFAASEGGYAASLKKNAKPMDPESMVDAQKFRDWVIDNARVMVL